MQHRFSHNHRATAADQANDSSTPNATILDRIYDLTVRTNAVATFGCAALAWYLAQACTGTCNMAALVAYSILVLQVYSADRLVQHPEDQQASNDANHGQFLAHHHRWVKALIPATIVVQIELCTIAPAAALALVLGVASAAAYMFRVPIINCRVKEIPFAKLFYVPIVITGIACVAMEIMPHSINDVLRMLGIWVLQILNVNAFDFKDRKSDYHAGIRTFANTFTPIQVCLGNTVAGIVCASILLVMGEGIADYSLAVALAWMGVASWGAIGPSPGRYLFVVVDGSLALPMFVYLILS
ncbi:MAG: hypothetical protein HN348_21070 [Proteobacteria bacterium]|jgi:hypothetical protein|nr:hypothetical protein [Pseudomonadota bacterium]